jgi:thiamine pyrophosphokinase
MRGGWAYKRKSIDRLFLILSVVACMRKIIREDEQNLITLNQKNQMQDYGLDGLLVDVSIFREETAEQSIHCLPWPLKLQI